MQSALSVVLTHTSFQVDRRRAVSLSPDRLRVNDWPRAGFGVLVLPGWQVLFRADDIFLRMRQVRGESELGSVGQSFKRWLRPIIFSSLSVVVVRLNSLDLPAVK